MARNVVRGTPYTHISPGGNEGFRQSGGNASSTVQPQYQGSGINTQTNARGTPAQYQHGNTDEFKRVVSSDRYGMVQSNQQGNANDPSNTGPGVLFAGMGDDNSPVAAGSLDSPVPSSAPVFEPAWMVAENRAHLGTGNEGAATGGLVSGGGVMSRGMIQKSTPNGPETELMNDDTLPGTGPVGR